MKAKGQRVIRASVPACVTEPTVTVVRICQCRAVSRGTLGVAGEALPQYPWGVC